MLAIALLATIVLVVAGMISIQRSGNDPRNAGDAEVEETRPITDVAVASPSPADDSASTVPNEEQLPIATTSTSDATATTTNDVQIFPSGKPLPTMLAVHQPVRGAPINGIQAVEEYYSEAYAIDNFVIAWPPGAFPPEWAEDVAAKARIGLDQVNRELGTNDTGRIEILLADEMYLAEDCIGCQGFAFSDRRQVFILQDGSMSDEEFQALLTHEIGHVIAGNYIALPHVATLFLAEGLATWLMTPDLVAGGFIEPKQIAAWAWKMGIIPPFWELRKAEFDGRTRARAEYDPAASFTQYVIETYGMAAYKRIYDGELPEDAMGKSYDQLEQEWHNWLSQWADNEVNGITAERWWSVAEVVIGGFELLYAHPESVTQEQYAQLATARVALNKGELEQALALMEASGLVVATAQ